jgi:hypothetical protein
MFKLLLSFAFLTVLASPALSFWRACHRFPNARLPDNVVTPLCDHERCFAARGEDFIANVTMSSPESHNELLSTNYVFIFGVGIPLPIEPPHDNGCNAIFINGIQQQCPTQPNRQYTWVIQQPIADFVPLFQNAIVECKF